jgi:hypothetical protein
MAEQAIATKHKKAVIAQTTLFPLLTKTVQSKYITSMSTSEVADMTQNILSELDHLHQDRGIEMTYHAKLDGKRPVHR